MGAHFSASWKASLICLPVSIATLLLGFEGSSVCLLRFLTFSIFSTILLVVQVAIKMLLINGWGSENVGVQNFSCRLAETENAGNAQQWQQQRNGDMLRAISQVLNDEWRMIGFRSTKRCYKICHRMYWSRTSGRPRNSYQRLEENVDGGTYPNQITGYNLRQTSFLIGYWSPRYRASVGSFPPLTSLFINPQLTIRQSNAMCLTSLASSQSIPPNAED